MKVIRYLEKVIFLSVVCMGAFKIMPLTTCGIICLFVLFITVISERQYFNKCRRPWIDVLSMFAFFKTLEVERKKFYLTGADKIMLNFNTYSMKKCGRCILEMGENVINNPRIAIEHRNEVKEIMENVRQKMEKEGIL